MAGSCAEKYFHICSCGHILICYMYMLNYVIISFLLMHSRKYVKHVCKTTRYRLVWFVNPIPPLKGIVSRDIHPPVCESNFSS